MPFVEESEEVLAIILIGNTCYHLCPDIFLWADVRNYHRFWGCLLYTSAKEQIRQIIADNNLSSVADVYSLLRDSFKDILQELMEAELDATLGYEKNQKGDSLSSNKRNGHSQKTLKSQYGEFHIDVPVSYTHLDVYKRQTLIPVK